MTDTSEMITADGAARRIADVVMAARDKAYAAWAAAGYAAGYAAGAASGAASRAAAWAAARDAARAAAWAAARDAARAAAWAAAWAALQPTVDLLQDSAISLYRQMITAGAS